MRFVAYLLATPHLTKAAWPGYVQPLSGNPLQLATNLRLLGCDVLGICATEQEAWRLIYTAKDVCGACAGQPDLNPHRCAECAAMALQGRLAASVQQAEEKRA